MRGSAEGRCAAAHVERTTLPLSQLEIRVVATLARAWETIRNRVDAHGLATVATRQLSCDKAKGARPRRNVIGPAPTACFRWLDVSETSRIGRTLKLRGRPQICDPATVNGTSGSRYEMSKR